MVVNDDAGYLTPHGALRLIASMLAPTEICVAPPVGGKISKSRSISYSLMRKRPHARMIRDPSATPSPKYPVFRTHREVPR